MRTSRRRTTPPIASSSAPTAQPEPTAHHVHERQDRHAVRSWPFTNGTPQNGALPDMARRQRGCAPAADAQRSSERFDMPNLARLRQTIEPKQLLAHRITERAVLERRRELQAILARIAIRQPIPLEL